MADRYIIDGAANCGDGTATNEAASAGAVGAWNNINILAGTAPTNTTNIPAAGDIIYIRSKTSGGADMTVTVGAAVTLGSTAATAAAPIRWILDGGTKWSGINGTLTYVRSANFTVTTRVNNFIVAEVQDKLVFNDNYLLANGNVFAIVVAGSSLDNCLFDFSATYSGSSGPVPIQFTGAGVARLSNPHILLGNKWSSGVFHSSANSSAVVIVNPTVEMPSYSAVSPVFYMPLRGGRITVYGGQVAGAGADAGTLLCIRAPDGGAITLIGMKYPIQMLVVANPSGATFDSRIEIFGADGAQGAYRMQQWGWMDSRSDGNYPTLNATYPDSVSTAWAWRVQPVNASPSNPVEVPMMKVYSSADAVRVVTVELQIATDFAEVNAANTWLEVIYIDAATGEPTLVSTRGASGALASSSASWSATTWGIIGLTKRKLFVETPTTIKQDTVVTAVLMSIQPAVATATDVYFVCPDIQLAAP